MNIAVLDDYLQLSQGAANWSALPPQCKITVFDRPLQSEDEAATQLAPFDIICLLRERMPISAQLLARLPNLKMIAITGLYNRTLDVAAATTRNITVSFTELRGSYRKATCELTWGLILSVARHIPYESNLMRQGGWQHTAGFTLSSRTLGLIGLGRQARHMVPIAKAFGMEVIAWSPNLTQDIAEPLGVTRVERQDLFARSDVVSVHLVLSERSRGLIHSADFAHMKSTAIIVNAARGAIINENDLITALQQRRIAGAGLDVFSQEPLASDSPLRSLDNVVMTPHQGHHVREFYEVAYTDVVENINAFIKGNPIRILTPERNSSQFAS